MLFFLEHSWSHLCFSFTIAQRSAKKLECFGVVLYVAALSSWSFSRDPERSRANSTVAETPFPRMLSGRNGLTLSSTGWISSWCDSVLLMSSRNFCCCGLLLLLFLLLYIRLHSRFLSACCLVSFSNRILLFDLHQGTRSLAQLPHRPAPPPKPRRSKKGVSPRLFAVLLFIFFQSSHLYCFFFWP